MVSLILCSGQRPQWSGQRSRQLAPVANELLIERTQRQALRLGPSALLRAGSGQAGDNCIVVTNVPSIQRHSRAYFIPEKDRWMVETILSTKSLWSDRTVVLLGDVIYSDEAMARILACERPVAMFGSHLKEFALSFSAEAQFAVEAALTAALLDALNGGRGKLWEVYRLVSGFDLREERFEDEVFHLVDDYTDDLDTIDGYYAFLDKNPWACPPGGRRGLLRSLD